jgi:starch synthase (maltosyl-transferring)
VNAPTTVIGQSVRAQRRVVIEGMEPEIDGGRFAAKRTVGEAVRVRADIFADGHDQLRALLRYRSAPNTPWTETEMRLVNNDRWQGEFKAESLGRYTYTVVAWVDLFQTWSVDLGKRADAGQDIGVDLLAGVEIVQAAAERARGVEAKKLTDAAAKLKELVIRDHAGALRLARNSELGQLVNRNRNRSADTVYDKELTVVIDPEKARFSTWYEMFPRSCTSDPQRHGTFRDCVNRLSYIAGMGFDVLYLPPIHPIGRTERKGKNNSTMPQPGDTGSPWAIGAKEGGHKSILPQLGTLEDFKELLEKARELGIDIALDIAYQCSPDHPYVKEHREWFRERPDGTVQYAENPPKKYQDIYPFNFESEHAPELWDELKSIVVYWIEQGVRVFRVDNPHTKPFAFWEWMINDVKRAYPEVIFLSEAFTRPKVMYQLAKLGFTQSYTYFAWKNTSWELTEYFTEIGETGVLEFFRPNLWPNTPDILNEYLQKDGRAAFVARLILAATLGASYGVYGPAFELCENRAVRQGSEEYLDSEKYQIRIRDRDAPGNIVAEIAALNRLRKLNPALQSHLGLRFYNAFNDQVLVYGKALASHEDMILVAVSLDPHHVQEVVFEIPLWEWRLPDHGSLAAEDLMRGHRFVWTGKLQRARLDPADLPFAIWRIAPLA